MEYDVYLQVARSGMTHAHVPELPGCNWLGKTPEEAWERAAQAIAVHLAWLRKHQQPTPPPEEPVMPRLAQRSKSTGVEGHLVGFFDFDRQPISGDEAETFLSLMECSRADLLELTQDLTDAVLDWMPAPNSWSIRQILRHVAAAEQWYLTRLLGTGALPRLQPAPSVWKRLDRVRVRVIEQLSGLSSTQRSEIVLRDKEMWTARKVFRRYLEHEREHYFHVIEVLDKLSYAHPQSTLT